MNEKRFSVFFFDNFLIIFLHKFSFLTAHDLPDAVTQSVSSSIQRIDFNPTVSYLFV